MIVHDVEQGTDAWFELRLGVPTASDFGKVITPKKGELSTQGVSYASKLALELFRGESMNDFEGNEYTEHGKEHEDAAIAGYEFTNDVLVQRVGFITDEKGRGCSPDGLVGDDGMVEVKCLKDVNHVSEAIKYLLKNEFDPKYIPQTQGQMMIAKRKWCDLVFHAPNCPQHIVRQYPDDKYQETMDKALDSVLEMRDFALSWLKCENKEIEK